MSEECNLLGTCGFFKKHQATKNLACRGFIKQFCKGPELEQCKRKEYRRIHGTPPADDMMPSGQMVVG
jgi:hypothetical protein